MNSGLNYEAWARNAVAFIRERGLEGEFSDWCGGWPVPVKATAPMIAAAPDLLEVARMIVEASDLSGLNGPLGEADRATRASTEPASGLCPDGRVSTDAGWGPPITVDGVCPEWLGLNEPFVWIKTNRWLEPFQERVRYDDPFAPNTREWCWRHHDGAPCIREIRLPADHPYYVKSGPTS